MTKTTSALRDLLKASVLANINHPQSLKVINAAGEEHASLLARLESAEKLLRASEWEAADADKTGWVEDGHYCWCCKETKESGHKPDCQLAQFLKNQICAETAGDEK